MATYVLFARVDPPGEPEGAAELAYQLRGGPVFEVLEDMGMAVPPKPTGQVCTPRRAGGHVVFADISSLLDNPAIREEMWAMGVPLIVDVHFPFGSPGNVLSVQPGATDETRDAERDEKVRDLWSRPERIAAAMDVLRGAAVIASPREDWAALLRGRLGVPVVVVPNVNSLRSAGQFFTQYMGALRLALGIRGLRGFIAGMSTGLMCRDVRKQVAALGIDWKARMEGRG